MDIVISKNKLLELAQETDGPTRLSIAEEIIQNVINKSAPLLWGVVIPYLENGITKLSNAIGQLDISKDGEIISIHFNGELVYSSNYDNVTFFKDGVWVQWL